MAKGQKTGGRKQGTPNKRTMELAERLEAIGCDPIEGMARIAMNRRTRPELRGRMYAELAQYLYPKRKAIEYSSVNTLPPEVIAAIKWDLFSEEELAVIEAGNLSEDLLARLIASAHGAAI